MSTGLIIAIVVVVLILVALFAFVLPRARRKAEVRARERELEQRRAQVADHHRTEAGAREREADMAQRKAQLAQAEAEKRRAEARMQEQRAEMHERGMADDELVADHEREHFAPALGDDRDRDGRDDRTEYEQGRVDERAGGRAHEPASDPPGRFDRQPDDAPAEPRRS